MSSALANFYQETRSARKVLVVDLGFLGDSIHLVPALREIRRHYPEAELHTLSAPVGAELLRLVPCVSQPWLFPLGSPSPPWWRHWDLILALRRERFDVAFNFSGADRTIFLTAIVGAKRSIAHPGGREHFWRTWLIRQWMPRQSRQLPVFEQRRQALAACGLALQPPEFGLQIPEADQRWAAEVIPAGSLHLSINTSTPLKEWPLRHWVELSATILRESPQLVLVATGSAHPREQDRLQQLARAVASPRLRTFGPELTIARLAALLAHCRLHVGGDSGVLHLALALGIPTVAVFRDYDGTAEWLPRGPAHRHLLAPCPCAAMKSHPWAPAAEARCLAQITPAAVLDAVRQLLAL